MGRHRMHTQAPNSKSQFKNILYLFIMYLLKNWAVTDRCVGAAAERKQHDDNSRKHCNSVKSDASKFAQTHLKSLL